MVELLRFATESGGTIAVQLTTTSPFRAGVLYQQCGSPGSETFEWGLRQVSQAAESALAVFRDGTLRPDGVEIEFGIRLIPVVSQLVRDEIGEQVRGRHTGRRVPRTRISTRANRVDPKLAAVPVTVPGWRDSSG